MPRLVLLKDDSVGVLEEEPYLDEAALQRLLEERPELIALDEIAPSTVGLIPIGREVAMAGQSLDLLFIEGSGRLIAVETKLRKNSQIRREVVGQTLEYLASLSGWTADKVEEQAKLYFNRETTPERFKNTSLIPALSDLASGGSTQERLDENEVRARIADRLRAQDLWAVIAVDRVVDPLRSIVTFLNAASPSQDIPS